MRQLFIGLLLLLQWTDSCSQTSFSWSHFTGKRKEYPVLSPLTDKMRTHYVGLQVDARLLKNDFQGFYLQQAGFRLGATSDAAQCFEAVFRPHPAELDPMTIEVELLAYDIRRPETPVARYRGQMHNLQIDQERSSVRCQLPVDLKLDSYHAFVLQALPPFHTMPIGKYREYNDQALQEGPWAADNRKEVFVYAPVPGITDYESQPSENSVPGPGMVYNEYGFPIKTTQAYWSKKGSNYAHSFQQQGLYGMKAQDGTVLITPQYSQLQYAYNGLMIATKGDKTGIINEANEVVIPFIYKNLELLYRNPLDPAPMGVRLEDLRLIARKEDDSAGIIDGRGKVVAPFHSSSLAFAHYFYPATRHSGGQMSTPAPEYARVRRQSALIYASDPAGAVNGDGKILLPLEYRSLEINYSSFHPEWVQVLKGDSLGLFDLNGNWVFPPGKYQSIGYLQLVNPELIGTPALLVVTADTPSDAEGVSYRKAGLVDSLGNQILPLEYDGFGLSFYWKDQLHCWVQKLGKWGLVNRSGQVLIPFEHLQPSRRINLAGKPHFTVQNPVTHRWSLLSIDNKQVLPADYLLIEPGSDQVLLVVDTLHKTTLLNAGGQRVLNEEYTDIQRLRYGYFSLMQNGRSGVADPGGKVLFRPEYTSVYQESYLPGMNTYFTAKGVKGEDVVTVLVRDNTSWALLRNGSLVEL
ncbi:MAG: hypothetical protein RJA20_1742 [Bacteroidota bacterium]